jgi:GT2 family glycosyltransferase
MKNNTENIVEPLVTVNILSYNRKDDLRNTLTKVFEQDYKNIEVIVVDNASSDGTCEMVESEFPQVKLIRLKENIGIAGWNKGFEIARGEYVLVLDDDSYPEPKSIGIALEHFRRNENLGIVAFNIYNSKFDFYETENWPSDHFTFVGCGALISKEKLDKVGYFDERIFIYLNEIELSARFLDAGFEIFFCKECKAIHAQSMLSRNERKNPFASKYRYENFFWSMSVFLLSKFSFPQIVFVYFKWLVNRFLIALKYFWFVSFVKLSIKVFLNLPKLLSERKQLKKEVRKIYNNGNVFAWIDRDYFPEMKR